ncbi:MAG TPA: aminotransferase class I/II-fold pyridoxal phosphate-dependent enzyme [Vicinamibacterales bacterium]|jgi:histidinol-phosphate aminotransferase|nr:aminotransferase class I/II-fold pyridoxal phosphate-dependent enzyme [Vicinamibacterales bacterium]
MLTRRRFVQTVGIGAAAYIGARGRENSIWSAFETPVEALEPGVICLASNENPLGPGTEVLDAVKTAFGPTGAVPGRYSGSARDLIDAIAKKQGVKPENVVLGCGSTQILRSATHLFTAKDKALVGTIPTYEECAGYAEMMGHPVRPVPLDADFKIDLGKFADAANGAGLVFYCNPNNPTATYVGARATREFLAKISKDSPDTTVLVDEAYFDYVTDPDHDTHIPIAVENPRVIVARTFSKAYGMAGLRIGYAVGHPETIKKMADWDAGSGTSSLNVLAMRAAIVAIQRDASVVAAERARNTAVRDFTMKWFADRGMKPTDSQANFMFVNIGRPAKGFRDACKAKGVLVARDFPPFEKTHCRISYGTMDEMKKAVAVFEQVLAQKAAAA